MALLPNPDTATVQAIYTHWQQRQGRMSRRLGASQIGKECERQLFYSFRWASKGEGFDGRMLRLFDRGHREEAVFVAELRGIGVQVHDLNPQTGEQFEFTGCGGHLVAKIDGAGLGVPEAPKTWHVLGFKTANEKSFNDTKKKGVKEAKPEHYAQNQIEMKLAGLTRTLYLMVNKNTDELYGERIREDEAVQTRLEEKAERVIFSVEPGPKLSNDPAFYQCKFCPAAGVCHRNEMPQVSCRTCLHATPERDGSDGRWSCARRKIPSLTFAEQQAACAGHLFIPALVTWGALDDASESEGWVQYACADGFKFRNGPRLPGSFSSTELAALSLAALRSEELQAIRDSGLPDAQFVAGSEWTEAA